MAAVSAWQNAAHGNAWVTWLDSGEWEHTLDRFTPMLPSISIEIAMLARDPEISARRLADAIGRDPLLAVSVIRLANSAFSASATTITSIDDAVVRVGTRAVRQLVTAACLTSKLRNPKTFGPDARALVDHSVGAAYLASLIAERVGADIDAAFLYGLLHDIGKFVILKLAHDDRPIPASMGAARLAACIAARHAGVGGRALERWRFAEEIRLPVAWHHDPDQAGAAKTSAQIAAAADAFAHHYGFGCEPDAADVLADPAVSGLGLDAAFVTLLDGRVRQYADVARTIAA